jgi:hypothetical protein
VCSAVEEPKRRKKIPKNEKKTFFGIYCRILMLEADI